MLSGRYQGNYTRLEAIYRIVCDVPSKREKKNASNRALPITTMYLDFDLLSIPHILICIYYSVSVVPIAG